MGKNLPGFAAEASLRQKSNLHYMAAVFNAVRGGGAVPAMHTDYYCNIRGFAGHCVACDCPGDVHTGPSEEGCRCYWFS